MTIRTGPGPAVTSRLGYLLKHALQHLGALSEEALAPFDIDDRQLAVLLLLANNDPMSQQQAAARLSIDRTTMVAVLDALEVKGFVTRTPHPADRRRNTVQLTDRGRTTLESANAAWDEAEQAFLGPLDQQAAAQFRASLADLTHRRDSPTS